MSERFEDHVCIHAAALSCEYFIVKTRRQRLVILAAPGCQADLIFHSVQGVRVFVFQDEVEEKGEEEKNKTEEEEIKI